MTFDRLNADDLNAILPTLTENDLTVCTLLNGDQLFGGVEPDWHWNPGIVTLSYNAPDGERFGKSYFLAVPAEHIAKISAVPLDGSSFPTLDNVPTPKPIPIKQYPNPLAAILYDHNQQVAAQHELTISEYAVKAFGQNALPPGGYTLSDEFLIYADWDFFPQGTGGDTSVGISAGVASIGRSLQRSLESQVMQTLKDNLISKASAVWRGRVGDYTVVQGCIVVPEPMQTDTIEGDECYLYRLIDSEGASHAFTLKVNKLKLPVGFFNKINSSLSFYGELLPMPVEIAGERYNHVLFARAIAFLKR